LAYKTEFGTDTRFEQKYIYPEEGCREALVNAITHRDYSAAIPIEIYIFDDRLQIKSPGALLSTLNLADILSLSGAHESRNSLIARVLREVGFVRELGEGTRRMFKLMSDRDLQTAQVDTDETRFSVTLFNKPVFTEQQSAWLELFARSNLSRTQREPSLQGLMTPFSRARTYIQQ
jgi:ATP-dependent DNA helicase RecG